MGWRESLRTQTHGLRWCRATIAGGNNHTSSNTVLDSHWRYRSSKKSQSMKSPVISLKEITVSDLTPKIPTKRSQKFFKRSTKRSHSLYTYATHNHVFLKNKWLKVNRDHSHFLFNHHVDKKTWHNCYKIWVKHIKKTNHTIIRMNTHLKKNYNSVIYTS